MRTIALTLLFYCTAAMGCSMTNQETGISFEVLDAACPEINVQENVPGNVTPGNLTSWEVKSLEFARTLVLLKYAETTGFNVLQVNWMQDCIQFMKDEGVIVLNSENITVANRTAVKITGIPPKGGRGYLVNIPVPNSTLVEVLSFDEEELETIIRTMSIWTIHG